jgi:hypothetical protein
VEVVSLCGCVRLQTGEGFLSTYERISACEHEAAYWGRPCIKIVRVNLFGNPNRVGDPPFIRFDKR